MMNKILFIIFMLFPQFSFSGESDNFHSFQYDIHERNGEISELAQKHLEAAIEVANRSSGCNQEALYESLRTKFANHTKGEFINDLLDNYPSYLQNTPLDESIYYNWKYSDGMALGLKKKKRGDLALSPLVKINEQIIGTDKLEHMFGMGYHYFKNYYHKNISINKVLIVGSGFEKFFLGGSFYATGIFSYGDLGANFNGMRFWNNILGKKPDILSNQKEIEPYVLCINQRWHSNPESSIDFSSYVDETMDESINCSKFARMRAADKIAYNVKELKKKTHLSYCQENTEIFKKLSQKYKAHNINQFILNYDGIRKFNYRKDIR